jgi:Leucine rich repeat/Leucine Rich Repeat
MPLKPAAVDPPPQKDGRGTDSLLPQFKDQVSPPVAAGPAPPYTPYPVGRIAEDGRVPLAEATPIEADDSSSPITTTNRIEGILARLEAQLEPESAAATCSCSSKQKLWIALGIVLVVVVVVLAVVIAIMVAGGPESPAVSPVDPRKGPSNPPSSVAPAVTTSSPAPTTTGRRRRAQTILSFINSITLSGRTLAYPSTASSEERALRWLIDDEEISNGDDGDNDATDNDEKQQEQQQRQQSSWRQRYALATLWFLPPTTDTPSFAGDAGYVATWATDLGECVWLGVTCDDNGVLGATTGRVTGLQLPKVGVTGRLPADVALLTDLTNLNLTYNDLTGPIPSSWGTSSHSLTSLTALDLGGNNLTGPIPSTFAALTALTGLWLFHNRFTGPLPTAFTSLTALEKMHLYNNQWSGTIPSSIGLMTALSELGLSNNKWRGTLPAALGDLTNLRVLYVHQNQLTGTIPSSLRALTALTSLELYSNRLSGSMPLCGFGGDSDTNRTTFTKLIADCNGKVTCLCCTHCCPGGYIYC